MKSEQINSQINKGFSNSLLHGNCVELLSGMSSGSAGFRTHRPAVHGQLFIQRWAHRSQRR